MASADLTRDAVDASVVPGVEVVDNDADPTDPLDGANPGDGTATARVVVSGPAGTVAGSASCASLMTIRAAAAQRAPSRDLYTAASNPVLLDAVGLGGAGTEAGTGVGTWVEGGGR